MLKLATKTTYKREISVDVPLDLGKSERQKFVMELKRLSVSDTKSLIAEATERTLDDLDMIKRYCVGWSGLVDSDGSELDYNSANLEMILDIPYIRKGIMDAFLEDVFGKEAVRKN